MSDKDRDQEVPEFPNESDLDTDSDSAENENDRHEIVDTLNPNVARQETGINLSEISKNSYLGSPGCWAPGGCSGEFVFGIKDLGPSLADLSLSPIASAVRELILRRRTRSSSAVNAAARKLCYESHSKYGPQDVSYTARRMLRLIVQEEDGRAQVAEDEVNLGEKSESLTLVEELEPVIPQLPGPEAVPEIPQDETNLLEEDRLEQSVDPPRGRRRISLDELSESINTLETDRNYQILSSRDCSNLSSESSNTLTTTGETSNFHTRSSDENSTGSTQTNMNPVEVENSEESTMSASTNATNENINLDRSGVVPDTVTRANCSKKRKSSSDPDEKFKKMK